jgi:cell division ATPase FtsA
MVAMPKLPFRGRSPKVKNFAVVEISSDFVKSVILEVDPATEAKSDRHVVFSIIGISHVSLEIGQVRAGLIIDWESVSFAVKSSVLDAAKDYPDFSGEIIFTLSGELSVGNITTVKVSHDEHVPIKKKEIDQIYKTVHLASLENASTAFMKATGNVDVPMELIISNDVYYKLDGSITSNLLNEHASEIETAVFSSYTPNFNISLYERVCKKAGFKLIGISPELFSLSLILKRLKGQFFDGVLVNMGSDFTEIGVVFGGGLVATKSMSVGGEHFIRAIATRANISRRDAAFKKQKYLKGELEPEEALIVQGMTSDILELWLDGIQILFEDFEGVKTFSSKIYLTGEDVEMPGLLDMLSKEPWTKSIPFKSPPEFTKVLCEDFINIKDTTGKCIGAELAPMVSAVEVYIFLNGMVN